MMINYMSSALKKKTERDTDKSDMSTTFEQHNSVNYLDCIGTLTESNACIK